MNEQAQKQLYTILAIAVAVLISVAMLLRWAGSIATQIGCQERPADAGLISGFTAIFGGDTSVMVTSHGCEPGHKLATAIAIFFLIALVALAVTAGWVWSRWRQSDARFVYDLKLREGFAQRREVRKNIGPSALKKRASTIRPSLVGRVDASDVGWKVGRSRGMDSYVSVEDSTIVIGPPRSGKGFRFIINAILDWQGPLVTTSTRNDNLSATISRRREMGQVTVFDPQELSGIETTLKISPIIGCEDPMVAEQRASALVAGSGLGKSNSNQEWASAAETILAQLLHAAALDQRTVADLATWGESPVLAAEAVEILMKVGAPGWGTALNATINGDEKMLMNQWFGVKGAVRPLRIPQIAKAMTPDENSQMFDPNEFLSGNNTLYLIGTGQGAGAVGGFLGALMDDIVEVARRKALASRGSRLDPPLGLILDEIANMFAWPALPRITADGGGIGISPLVVLQARSQAETSWSHAEMQSVFSAATAKLMLGGSADVSFLKDMQDLLGQRRVQRKSRTFSDQGTSEQLQQEQQQLITMDEFRRMPQRIGLLAYRNIRPVILDLDAWLDRDDAAEISAGKAKTEQAQQERFAIQLEEAQARRASVGKRAGSES